MDVVLLVAGGQRAEFAEVGVGEPDPAQGPAVAAPDERRVEQQGLVLAVVEVEEPLARREGPVEPLAGVEPVVVAGGSDDHGPDAEVGSGRGQSGGRLVLVAVQLAAAQDVEGRGDHPTAVALADQGDPAPAGKARQEDGQVIRRDEGPPPFLVDVAEVLAVDPLARPVEGDHDGVGRERAVMLEPAMRPEQAAERGVGRRQAPLDLDQDRMAGDLGE